MTASSVPKPANLQMANAFKQAAESLANETDRGSVVLAAAWLDESLTSILMAYMKPTERKDDLLSPGRPLGDFGTKIALADRLRLIHPSLLKSLDMVRRLRNDFAHIASDLTFETSSVKDRVSLIFRENEDLLLVMGNLLISNGMVSVDEGEKVKIENMVKCFGTKKLFQYTCAILNSALAVVKHNLRPAVQQYNQDPLNGRI
ncbi:hypothetical protein [Pseudomonas putida]|nr:hypothetical protein [Pseudomonas putida]